jgi:hypothetical protein
MARRNRISRIARQLLRFRGSACWSAQWRLKESSALSGTFAFLVIWTAERALIAAGFLIVYRGFRAQKQPAPAAARKSAPS